MIRTNRLSIIGLLLLIPPLRAHAITGTISLSGSQSAHGDVQIDYKLQIIPRGSGCCGIQVAVTKANSQVNSTNTQTVSAWNIQYQPTPDRLYQTVDSCGNTIYHVTWGDTTCTQIHYTDTTEFAIIQTGTFSNKSTLNGLVDGTPYPNASYPDSVQIFLHPTPTIESDNPALISYAESHFIQACSLQYQVVRNVFNWVFDSLRYCHQGHECNQAALDVFADTLDPNPDNRHCTKCVGYAQLPIAFLRALGIPARYVRGTEFGEPYNIPTGIGYSSNTFFHGPHAWVEVYYDNAGWVPYDGQISLHHIFAIRTMWNHNIDYKSANLDSYSVMEYYPHDSISWGLISLEFDDFSQLDCSGGALLGGQPAIFIA